MSKKKRCKHSNEFKEEAVKLVKGRGYQVSEAAQDLSIHPNVLGRWKRKLEAKEGDDTTPGSLVAMQSELEYLRKENK